jgi:hypothetical protein
MDFAGDASGADEDVETVPASGFTTMTGWKAEMTPGHWLTIFICRDGNASQDSSTTDSITASLVMRYGVTQ